jgi:hypothetical protein
VQGPNHDNTVPDNGENGVFHRAEPLERRLPSLTRPSIRLKPLTADALPGRSKRTALYAADSPTLARPGGLASVGDHQVLIGGEDAYLREHGVTLDRVATVTPQIATLFRAPTPVLSLVDRHGRVQRVWRGQLDAGGERELIEALSGPART